MSQRTPFYDIHTALGARFAEYDGWELPSDYGDVEAESAGLCRQAATFDLTSFGRVNIEGPGSEGFVEGLLSKCSGSLEEGKWVWAVLGDGGDGGNIVRVAKLPKSFVVLTLPWQREAVAKLIEDAASAAEADDMKVSDVTSSTGMQAVYGPVAFETLKKMLPIDISALEENGCMSVNVFMMQMTILRGSWLGVDGVEIIAGSSACKLAAGAMGKYHEKYGIVPAGMKCLRKALAEAAVAVEKADWQAAVSAGI